MGNGMAVIILDAIAHFIEATVKERVIAGRVQARVQARGAIANFIEKGQNRLFRKTVVENSAREEDGRRRGGDMAVKAQNHLYQSLKDPVCSLSN